MKGSDSDESKKRGKTEIRPMKTQNIQSNFNKKAQPTQKKVTIIRK